MQVQVSPSSVPPRITITTDAESVERVHPDGSRFTVRPHHKDADGTFVDYEAPQCVPVTYDDGTVSGEVEMPDVGMWLIPVTEPQKAAPMVVAKDGAKAWDFAETRAALDIPGGRPFVVSTKSPARSTSVALWSLTASEWDRLSAALTTNGGFFVSVSPRFWPWRGVTYVDVSEVAASPTGNDPYGEELWGVEFTVTEIDRPEVYVDNLRIWDAQLRTWNEAGSEPWVLPA